MWMERPERIQNGRKIDGLSESIRCVLCGILCVNTPVCVQTISNYNQSINQSINRSINQSINQSIFIWNCIITYYINNLRNQQNKVQFQGDSGAN